LRIVVLQTNSVGAGVGFACVGAGVGSDIEHPASAEALLVSETLTLAKVAMLMLQT
jgi:hypothetical protein